MGETSLMGGFLKSPCAYVSSAPAHDTSCLSLLCVQTERGESVHHSDSGSYLDVSLMMCVFLCACQRQRQVALMTVGAVTVVLGDSQQKST